MASCSWVLEDRIKRFIKATVKQRVHQRCYAEPLLHARYAAERLRDGDYDSAVGGLVAAEKESLRCKLRGL